MKILVDGSRFYGGQCDRIEDGFRQLGHEITTDASTAQLLYSNDMAHYDHILSEKLAGRAKGKVIFTVLDLALHNKDFDFEGLAKRLAFADRVCSISQYVQWQLKSYLNVDSTVIYQPVKEVSRNPAKKVACPYRFLSAARRSDPNKRVPLWVGALQMLDVQPQEVALAGNEGGWGDYLGVQSDENLSRLYNSVDFVMSCGKIEGLALNVPEAMAAGAIPVICNDMTTREELLPPDLFPEYVKVTPDVPAIAHFLTRFLNNPEAMAEMKTRLFVHYQANWAHRLSGRAVAQAILDVYQTL